MTMGRDWKWGGVHEKRERELYSHCENIEKRVLELHYKEHKYLLSIYHSFESIPDSNHSTEPQNERICTQNIRLDIYKDSLPCGQFNASLMASGEVYAV